MAKGYSDFDYNEGIYNEERNKRIADQLDAYVDAVENLLIIDGVNVDEIEEAKKTVRKMTKRLRNGKPEKVFDEDKFEELLEQGLIN